jgi:hypothetical protein
MERQGEEEGGRSVRELAGLCVVCVRSRSVRVRALYECEAVIVEGGKKEEMVVDSGAVLKKHCPGLYQV